MKNNLIHNSIIIMFISLYLLVSVISTIHVIDFFKLSNPTSMAITLAIAFELGAASCLGAIVVLDKLNKYLIWFLFLLITCIQMLGNMYYAFIHITDITKFQEMFDLIGEDVLLTKQIIAIITGAILPIIALGFIKALVDYIKPNKEIIIEKEKEKPSTSKVEPKKEVVKTEIKEVPNIEPKKEVVKKPAPIINNIVRGGL